MSTRVLAPASVWSLSVPNYNHGVVVSGAKDWMMLSGQVGVGVDGVMKTGFAAQCKQAFANIAGLLAEGGMTVDDVVFLRIYMLSRDDIPAFRVERQAFFGDRTTPSTLVFVSGLVNPEWLVELEVGAAKG